MGMDEEMHIENTRNIYPQAAPPEKRGIGIREVVSAAIGAGGLYLAVNGLPWAKPVADKVGPVIGDKVEDRVEQIPESLKFSAKTFKGFMKPKEGE